MKNLQDVAKNKWLRLGCSISLAFALSLVLLMIPITAGQVIRLSVPYLAPPWESSSLKPGWPSGRSIDLPLPFGTEIVRATGGLTITKSASPSAVNQGGLLTYILVVRNDTTFDLTDVVVVDTVPANTTCQDIQNPSGWFNNGVANCQNDGEAKWLLPKLGGGSLADGSTAVLTYTIQVDQPLPDLSTIENITYSVVASDTAGTRSFSDVGSFYTTTVYAPAWQISKSVTPTPNVEPSDLLTYTISVLNDGHLDASGLYTVTDLIPQYTTYITSTPPAAQAGNVLTWLFSDPLTIGHSSVVTFLVQVGDHPLPDGLSIVNDTYSVAGANVYAGAAGSPVAVTVQAPDLQITKSDYVEPIWAGGTLTYTLVYSNSGGADATGVIISDTIDGMTDFVDSTPISSSNVGDTYYWDIGALSAGNSGSIVITVSVHSPLPSGTVLTNTAGISSPMGYADQATEMTTVAGSPVLHLLKEASTEIVEPGELITYTISYSNSGNAPAFGVRITDTIDGNTSFENSDPLPDGGSYYWDIGELWPSTTHQITLTVRVTDSLPNETILTNQVIIRDSGRISDTNQATVTVQSAPILLVAKEASANVIEPGDTLTYTIWYSNTGNAPAIGVVITDDLQAGLHFLSAEPSPSIGGDQKQVWIFSSVNVGGPYSITLVVTSSNVITDMTDLTNQVTLSSVETSPVVVEETVTVHAVELSADKTSSAGLVKANEFITYTITVMNNGHAIADQVRITDTLPISIVQGSVISSTSPGVVFDSATPPEYVWTAPTLDALSQLTITISGRLITSPWTASGEVFSNTVQVGSENTEVDLVNNSDLAPVTSRPGDPYTITLTAAATETVVGDIVPVTATITDQWGNPAYDEETVFFDSSLGVTLPAFTNSQSGVATTTLSSLQAGEAIITGTVGGIDATTSVTFLAGALDHFAVSVTSPQTAGITFTTVITALDQYGNLVDFDGTVTLTDTTGTLLPTGLPSLIDGQGAVSVTIYTATPTDVITATGGITPIIGVSSPFVVLPGKPDKLMVAVEPTTIRVCQTAAVTATIIDEWGNPVPSQPITLTTTTAPPTFGSATILPPSSGDSDGNGVFAATMQGASEGTVNVYAQSGPVNNFASPTVATVSGSPLPSAIFLDVSPNPLYTGGATAVVTATVDDCLPAPPLGQVVSFALSNSSLAWFAGPTDTYTATTDANGIATATLTSNSTPVAGTLTITGAVEGQVDVTSLDVVLAPTTSLTITKTASPPGGDVEPGQTLNYTLVARNIGGEEATNVLISDTLPAGVGLVSIIKSSGTISSTTPINVFTNTLATGEALTVTIEVTVTSEISGTLLENQASVDSDETAPAISRIVSHQVITSTGGNVFLPIIVKNWSRPPADLDLEVIDIRFAGGTKPSPDAFYDVEVVIKNTGSAPVITDFFVGLYLNPSAPPSVGVGWQQLSQSGASSSPCEAEPTCYGRAWVVTTNLGPGDTLALSTDPTFNPPDTDYHLSFDRWPRPENLYEQPSPVAYASRHTPIVAFVDAMGAVSEADENNNQLQLNVEGLAQGFDVTSRPPAAPPSPPISAPSPHPTLPLTVGDTRK
jgi:uncharacterized repeat protein (TIGR01451 family)